METALSDFNKMTLLKPDLKDGNLKLYTITNIKHF